MNFLKHFLIASSRLKYCVIASLLCTCIPFNLSAAENDLGCKYFETAIENLLVDKMLFDIDKGQDFKFGYAKASPFGRLHGGMLPKWNIIISSHLTNHASLGCDSLQLIKIYDKIPMLSKMGGELLFVDQYFNTSKGQYSAGTVVKENISTPLVATVPSAVDTNKSEPPEKKSVMIEKFLVAENKDSILDRMVWRQKIDYAGYNSTFVSDGDLFLLNGFRLKFYDGMGNVVATQETPKDVYYNTAYDYSKTHDMLVFEADGEIHIWNLTSALTGKAQPLVCFGHTRHALQIKFSKETQHVFTISDDGTQRVFEFSENQCKEISRYKIDYFAKTVTTSGLIYGIYTDIEKKRDYLKSFNLFTGEEKVLGSKSSDYSASDKSYANVAGLRFLPKSKRLIAFGSSTGIRENYDDLANMWLINTVDGSTDFIVQKQSQLGSGNNKSLNYSALAYSFDERFVAYLGGYSGNEVYVADLNLKEIVHVFEGIDRDAQGIVFAPNSHSMIVHSHRDGGAVHYFALE